ncbi:MAG: DNA polymerase I [Bacteroidetes bacterium]|nr:DNA polymerase I [Bacteroidota bacterium]MDA1119164.1 DNA polymerase I [Bacteroidota bacterium]
MSQPEKKLFLIDAMALIYRAYYAFKDIPRLNSKGLNTGASLGFTNALVEILTKEKPTHIAVAFDTPAPTFRHKEFVEYKANREKQPEDIKDNIPWIKKVIKGFNIPILELDGFEADDVIGTFAKKAAGKGFEVFMMTPDKDFAQLVDEHVYLYKPAYRKNPEEIYGVKEILEKYGFDKIDQMRDFLGLQGDSVDNIPGIPGVGPKTAIKLIQKYGSIEELIKHTNELHGRQKDLVEEHAEQAILSKHLATIHTDVPIDFIEEELLYNGPDEKELRPVFEELEFRTLIIRIFGKQVATPEEQKKPSSQLSFFDQAGNATLTIENETKSSKSSFYSTTHNYSLIDTPELRKSLIEYLGLQKEIALQLVAEGIVAVEAKVIGISFSYVVEEAYYIPIDKSETLLEFKDILENERISKVGHNLKFDIQILKRFGIELKGSLFDTMLAHYLIDPEMRNDLEIISENYLDYTPLKREEFLGKKASLNESDDVDLKEICGEFVDLNLRLATHLRTALKKDNLESLSGDVETPLIRVLADIEFEGVTINPETLSGMSEDLENDSSQLQKEIFEIAGEEFNIGSPKQLGDILFDKLKLIEKPKKTRTGQYSTNEEVLVKLAGEHEIAKKIMEFREYQKLKSTYVDALPKMISAFDGRIHTDYRQTVAATGRLSSNNPNLQNIPIRTEKGREIRKAFIPRNEDYLILSADYSQIELRIMASFSKDESMIEAFREGRDIHATTAAKIFDIPLDEVDDNMRRMAKSANFGIIYGISAFGLANNLNIPRSEASEFIRSYFREFPAVKKYMDEVVNIAREQEYVETILGRRRYLPEINSRNMTGRGFAERNAINAPIQGSAADIIKIAMINIHRWMKENDFKSKMIMQVHDELVFDIHKDELDTIKDPIVEFMKNAHPLEVPMGIGVGVGQNWLEAH